MYKCEEELNRTSMLMDPRGLNVNEPSISDDRTPSKERDHPTLQIVPGNNHNKKEDGAWGSPRSPKPEQMKNNEDSGSDQVPFRKARVSVRARSEAPLV